MPATCFFSDTIIAYIFGKFFRTKSLNTKQCPADYTPCISFVTKSVLSFDVALLLPSGMDCFPPPQTFVQNPRNGGIIPPNS